MYHSDHDATPSRRDDQTDSPSRWCNVSDVDLSDPSSLWDDQIDDWHATASRRDDGLNITFGKW